MSNREKIDNKVVAPQYSQLGYIGKLLQQARRQVASQVNTTLLDTYWHIGKYIVEYEQQGQERAVYGDYLIDSLSRDLTTRYGKRFSKSNLLYIRKFYSVFQKGGTVSHQLSWSHYFEILKLDDPLEIQFYVRQCELENWSVRELKWQKQSMRLAQSTNKDGVLKLAQEGKTITKPEDIIRDPVVLEFVGLPTLPVHKEADIENAHIQHLEQCILKLGKGFAFIGRQYKITIGGFNN